MITLDTSGLISLGDRSDPSHTRVEVALRRIPRPYLVPVAILSELAYMLESRGKTQALGRLLDDLENGYFQLDCGEENIPRIRQLVSRYGNLPLGLADASVIACAERHGGQVLSLDRDFWIVAREGTIRILPG